MTVDCKKWGLPRKLLLATDLSARCDRALERTVGLASEWKATCLAVHAMPNEGVRSSLLDTASRPDRASHTRSLAENSVRAELGEIAPSLSLVIETGDPADVILRTARSQGCDLIVTGVAHDEPFGRVILGSTVAQLIRYSEVPVLVVRKRASRPYSRIVVATDFSESSRHALDATLTFFPHRNLTLFHAYDAPMSLMASDVVSHRRQFREAAERDGQAFLASVDFSAEPGRRLDLALEQGDPGQAVCDYVSAASSELVALGTHGRGAVFHAMIGSVAQSLVETLPCDVLVVRDPSAIAAAR